ncbi:MAG: PrpF family protein [Rhodospirillaceae bacterium]|nr:PrpF family protein [Rhodospirillaceae bacterium]
MAQIRIPATFMRGGSSKGVFFHARDVPKDPDRRNQVILATIGSPDPYGRQLNGMGGGVSSVSKAVVIGPSSRDDADLDYTFAQVAVSESLVDYASNCGNLSSAVGPFAIDSGLVSSVGECCEIMIHNTNSCKLIRATVPLVDGMARVDGDFEIPGVSGSGARIRLDFLDPGGTSTGSLLPTRQPVNTLIIEGEGAFEASLVDSGVPCAFLSAERFGLSGSETVAELEANSSLMKLVERLRRAAAVTMQLADAPENAPASAPKIGLVARPSAFRTLAGVKISARQADLSARIWSMGQVHRVLPLTGAMCLAVACRIPGSICQMLLTRDTDTGGGVRLANPSGILPLDSQVTTVGNVPIARHVTAYRTARTLMEGMVFIPKFD